jgi:hypothetical protein
MPTYYTGELFEGEMDTFKEFALKCMENFSEATFLINSKNKSILREPDISYYENTIFECEKRRTYFLSLSDEDFMEYKKHEYLQEKRRTLNNLSEIKKKTFKIQRMMFFVNNYKPTSDKYEKVKQFMANQLTQSLEWDCNNKFHLEMLELINHKLCELKNINKVREETIREIDNNILNYKGYVSKEISSCINSNEWVRGFYESLKNL